MTGGGMAEGLTALAELAVAGVLLLGLGYILHGQQPAVTAAVYFANQVVMVQHGQRPAVTAAVYFAKQVVMVQHPLFSTVRMFYFSFCFFFSLGDWSIHCPFLR